MAQKRTFLFALSESEKEHPNKLCSFAQKVPAIAKTGDQYQDEELDMQREAFQRSVGRLWRNPGIVLQAGAWIEKRVDAIDKRASGDLFASVSTLSNIDETWLCDFLVVHFGFTREVLEDICGNDPEAMVQLLQYGLVSVPRLKLGDDCKHKLVLERALLARLQKVGARLQDLATATHLLARGGKAINWAVVGMYSVCFDESGVATKVTHRPTGDFIVPEAHVRITKRFMMQSNWSDYTASLNLKPSNYNLADLFEDGQGPHKMQQMTTSSKEWATLVKAAVKVVRAPSASSPADSKKFRADDRAKSKQDNMAKARVQLMRKKADLQSKRVIKFD